MSIATPVAPRPTYSAVTLWSTLLVVLLADALDLIDSTVTNVAAPTIVGELGGGRSLVTWLTAAYALALGSLLVLGGRLGDRYGQRRTLLVGIGGFVVASAACGLSVDPAMLVAARTVQGAFGALMIPQGMAIMTRTFPRPALAKAFAAFGPLLGVFSVGGPVLAGFLIDADVLGLTWRPIFLINVVLGGIALVVAIRVVPAVEGDPRTRIDGVGAALLTAAMFGLVYGLITGSAQGWHATALGSLAGAAALLAGFVVRQRRSADPLIPPGLFRNRGFVSGLVVGLLVFAAFNGLVYVLALYFQYGVGDGPARTSLDLLPLTVGIILAAGASMALVGRLGRRLVLAGLLLSGGGAVLLLVAVLAGGVHAPWWHVALAVTVIGAGAGASFTTIFDTALGDVAADEAGAASGSLNAVQQLAAGAGSALVASIYLAAAPAGQAHAVAVSLVVVACLCAVCLVAVPLLPRRAAELGH